MKQPPLEKLGEYLLVHKIAGSKLRRLGSNYADGGYICPDKLLERSETLYNYGVGNEVEFELDYVALHPRKTVRAFDHTIDSYPKHHRRISFHGEGLGDSTTPRCDRFENHMRRHGDQNKVILLKVDVEGAEYEYFPTADMDVFRKNVCGIILEIHFLDTKLQKAIEILQKLGGDFVCTHWHNNNWGSIFSDGVYFFPTIVEITLANRHMFEIDRAETQLPLDIDLPCHPHLPEFHLDLHRGASANHRQLVALSLKLKELFLEEKAAAKAAAEDLRREAGCLGRKVSDLESSTSWKVTAPMRLAVETWREVRTLPARFAARARSRIRTLPRRVALSRDIYVQHRRSGVFDKAWYLAANKHVPRWGAFLHFCIIGAFRDRAPNSQFDSCYYSARNPESRTTDLPPLVHYLLHGFSRGTKCGLFDKATIENFREASRDAKAGDFAEAGPCDSDIRCIAFYLPQFHTIPENDEWWGKGFTEWTNVRRGEPLYRGHYQPHVPHPQIGYYDLNDPAVMERQAALARAAGIEGFCFYYYWFDGKRLLEMPTDRMLSTGRPDFPFCFCWANENWTRRWDGNSDKILMEHKHGPENDERFIRELLPAFRDHRYIWVNGRPLLLVYRPGLLPDPKRTARTWRRVCREEGIGEICLAYTQSFDLLSPHEIGFDYAIQFPPLRSSVAPVDAEILPEHRRDFGGKTFDYRKGANWFAAQLSKPSLWPGVFPSWDNTARRMQSSHSWLHAAPEHYFCWLKEAADHLRRTRPENQRLLFVNAWNEWAEGCHLEPDERHGYGWLAATRLALQRTDPGESPGKNETLLCNPAVAAGRWERLDALFGCSLPRDKDRFILNHVALLSVFVRQGHRLRRDADNLIAETGGTAFALDSRPSLHRVSDALWGDPRSVPFCFVLLQYNQWEFTRKCVESIRQLDTAGRRIHIVIVDNASDEEAVAQTRGLFGSDPQISLIFNKENLGFARGNNVGYRHAKTIFADSFIVVMNNDIVVEDAGFLDRCVELYREWSFSVLGPDIATPAGRHENPWNDYVYGVEQWAGLKSMYVRQRDEYLQTGLAEFRRLGERHPESLSIVDPLLQGACYIFSPIFTRCHDRPFDESSFLYGEEFPLAVLCLLAGHMTFYSGYLCLRHEEGVSTGLVPDRRKIMHGYDGALLGIDLSISRLQRQIDALAGLPFPPDKEQIGKLATDGRKHVLVDLFFCQPSFHGGGEYGKAVFRGLVESATRMPGLQLWAALDPDLYIDEWVWKECRRLAINIVQVKSFDDIVALVDLGCFHSFFTPGIVVYTGYEYMRRVGGGLKFSDRTPTRIVGTLLDVRDFELAAGWEEIARARKTAGCQPEIGFTAEQWAAEKTRQAKHAEELRGMYRRICSHGAVDTLVTISDYSARSIKSNIGGVESVEILFAPEKNRPQVEAAAWPGIDFAEDPYLLVLNAGRFEKNAAAVVAALDRLFLDPDFAAANSRLKLVLVGLRDPGELGLKDVSQRKRIIAIPHLSASQFEYVLGKARGLVYASFNEGFGYPPLEAMSLGVPCVVSEGTSIPEVCGDAAFYCDAFDVDSVAAAIRRLLLEAPDPGRLKAQAAKVKQRQNRDLRRLADLILSA